MILEFEKPKLFRSAIYSVLSLVVGLLFFWSFLRLYLFLTHRDIFTEVPFNILFFSFLNGVRFDLSTIFYTNLIFFFLIYFQKIKSSYIYRGLFIALNTLLGLLHLADVEYFGLVGRRLDRSFLSIVGETKMASYSSFLQEYSYVFVLLIGFALYLFYMTTGLNRQVKHSQRTVSYHIKRYVSFFLILSIVTVLCVRGGFQRKPLAIIHAYDVVDGDGNAANLSLNTVYNFIRSKSKSPFPEYYRNAAGPFITDKKFENTDVEILKKPKNIVFVFIESMSTYSIDLNEDSFIRSFPVDRPKDSIYIADHFGNGRFSMDALTSVFLGVPSFFELFLFKSNFAQNKWVGLGEVLKKEGFDTFFIHAAKPGTMYFDKIAPAVGITDFYSLAGKDKDVPIEMIAPWGVHDEYMYKKSIPIIDSYKKPFMGVLFSVSSHFNYDNTPGDNSPRGTKEENYHRTIEYAEESLKGYFESIKDKPWFKETLFVVTGDHSPPIKSKWLQTARDKSRVPLLLYFPGSNIGELPKRSVTQHLDLSNTIFDLLEIQPKEWSPYGKSMFDTKSKNLIGYYWDQSFNFVEEDCLNVVSVINQGKYKSVPRTEDAQCRKDLSSEQISEYQDFIKSYVNRLEKNQMYN